MVVTTVVRPARAARSRGREGRLGRVRRRPRWARRRAAPRGRPAAPGPAGSAAAGRRRGCGPAAGSTESRPAGSPSTMSCAAAARTRGVERRIRRRTARIVPAGDHLAHGAGEQLGLVVGDQDPVPDRRDRDLGQPRAAPGGVRLDEPAEPVDDRRRVGGPGADQRGQPARAPPARRTPGRAAGRRRRAVGRVRRVDDVGAQVEEAGDPAGGDQCPAEVVAAPR